jgi:hypothetical protein
MRAADEEGVQLSGGLYPDSAIRRGPESKDLSSSLMSTELRANHPQRLQERVLAYPCPFDSTSLSYIFLDTKRLYRWKMACLCGMEGCATSTSAPIKFTEVVFANRSVQNVPSGLLEIAQRPTKMTITEKVELIDYRATSNLSRIPERLKAVNQSRLACSYQQIPAASTIPIVWAR